MNLPWADQRRKSISECWSEMVRSSSRKANSPMMIFNWDGFRLIFRTESESGLKFYSAEAF
jgi:hypothetical protein